MKTIWQTSCDLAMGHSIAELRAHRTRAARLLALLALIALAASACTSSTPTFGPTDALDESILGTAQSFAVLGGSTVTNTGATTVHGNLGVDPGLAVTGFPPGLVTGGTIHAGDAVALQAQNDTTTAYNALAGQAPTADLTGQDLGGKTLTPGVYSFSSSAQLTGALTLNGQGDPSAVFVFQIGSTLTTASNSSVLVLNGAEDCNIFWQVGSSATLGTTTAFKGNILALTSITLNTGATVSGRTLARNAAVTMDANTVSVLTCATATDAGLEGGSVDAGIGDGGGPTDATSEAGKVDTGADARGPIDATIDTGRLDAGVDSGASCDAIVENDSSFDLDAGSGDVCDSQPAVDGSAG
jgi:hypothetical protein